MSKLGKRKKSFSMAMLVAVTKKEREECEENY